MSEENVETARRLYPGTLDVAALLENPEVVESIKPLVHPDFETVVESGQIPMGNQNVSESGRLTAYGVDGFTNAWRDWLSAWESWLATPTEFIDVDADRVLVLLDIRARSKTHQVEVPLEGANLLTLRDGKLARLELFWRRAEALEAAGLAE